ncbi:fasciclin domain-containing protein [Gramella jeungdoensis]|uniref:Fasciclin domain-containing protein n=1 Tax=Gramella jeungdoensis TaxID=708091 RepID=A0ABT0YYX2_9FLAO|nr:fasciclin domain-containing protein [Gramella jeungdoensis]MCM8568230.1 fasciclin domain-containing protein [Gramella jeungdoensis]
MNFILRNAKFGLIILLSAFVFVACDKDDDFNPGGEVNATPNPEPDPDPTDDGSAETNSIVDFASANGFTSLGAAVEAAGLTATLSGDTEYTVFAPTNDAFDAFLSDNGFESLDEVPEDVLTLILMNHVQAGSIMSSDLSTGYIQSMAEAGPDGENLSLYINVDDGVVINGVSTVTSADNEVDNGVVHAVDAVIGLPDVTTFAMADPSFETLVAALTREDSFTFVETLQSTEDPAPFTVFAPTNDAFANLLAELELSGLADLDAATLQAALLYHVVGGANVTSDELTDGMEVNTLQEESFTVNLGDDVVITDVNERTSTVIAADVQAVNGVIHVIDTVLLPTL